MSRSDAVRERPSDQSIQALMRTFLFTDIAGSSRRWEVRPAEMNKALARHDGIVSQVVAVHDGQVVKHTGDGFSVVFERPLQAVEAAVALQRRLQQEDFSEVGDLPVRIGVHSGRATPRDGDWFGSTVNRAARLMGAAEGGQILASHETARRVRTGLPDDVQLDDLGDHVLHDLGGERIYQVGAAGLPADFPPLRSLSRYRTNLPAQMTSFVGRQQEIERVTELLAGSSLVTITGVGGGGKTRLALQTAGELLDDFADGVFVVEFAGLDEPLAVPRTTATTVGHFDPLVEAVADDPEDAARATAQHLVRELADEDVLLVLDNCEHLLGAVADLAGMVRQHCPGVRMLATSREPLRLPAEQRFEIPPMGLAPSPSGDGVSHAASPRGEAAALFLERAREVRPDLEVEGKTGAAIAHICRRLDGLPLAIELAAAEVESLSAVDIAVRLDDALEVLGDPGASGRHATLEATIGWSYQRLTPHEQRLLRRLSTFRGGVPPEGVQAVAAVEPETEPADALARALVGRSLLRLDLRSDTTRYQLLEPVRQFAEQLLGGTDEAPEVRRAHARWVLQRFDETSSGTSLTADVMADLRRDEDNLRAAFEWARRHDEELTVQLFLTTVYYWHDRADFPTSEMWARTAIDRLGEEPSEEFFMAEFFLAWTYETTGQRSRSNELYEKWTAIGEELGIPAIFGFAGQMLARSHALEGRVDEADRLFERSERQLREAGDEESLSWGLTNRAWTALWHDRTTDRARRAAESILELDDPGVGPAAMAECTIGMIGLLDGHTADGVSRIEAGLDAIASTVDRTYMMPFLARLELALPERHAAGVEHLREGLQLMRDTGQVGYLQFAVEAAAAVRGADVEFSAMLFGAADDLYEQLRTVHPGPFGEHIADVRDEVRTALGQNRYEQRVDEGRRLSIEDRVDLALRQTEQFAR